ncbi:MAG: phosphotransferase [Pseudoxanthomonas suwonensis]|nr:phosphotransferase [Pseudoxanthomonas suwonensis]
MSVINREGILALVPHQQGMCLWDAVLEWDDARIVLQADSHRDAANPLRGDGRLHALHLCEYGAQAMAVHGGLLARDQGAAPRPGMLVALRGVQLHADRIDTLPGPLRGEARVVARSADSQQYAFTIRHHDQLLAVGRAAVMLGPLPGT